MRWGRRVRRVGGVRRVGRVRRRMLVHVRVLVLVVVHLGAHAAHPTHRPRCRQEPVI